LKVFQQKLEQFKGKDGILLSEAQKTQNEIMGLISRSYDQKELKGKMASEEARNLRKDVKALAKESKADTVPKILGLLQKVMDLGCELTADEQEFYNNFDGADFEKVNSKAGKIRSRQTSP
jgi:hypothetical protein